MTNENGANGLTPDYIIFPEEGDILVAAAPGGYPGVPRGKALALGPSGYVLASNGTDPVWVPYTLVPGTVTSINVTGSSGLIATGGPINSSGTINVALANPTISQFGENITGQIDLQTGLFSLTSTTTGGTVTNIAVTSSTGDLSITGSPITTAGTINLELPVQNAG